MIIIILALAAAFSCKFPFEINGPRVRRSHEVMESHSAPAAAILSSFTSMEHIAGRP